MKFGEFEIPRSAIGLVLVLFNLSLAYGVIVGNLTAPIAVWAGLVQLAVTLFVVYLLYRFILAVETIANKL